MVTKRRLRSVFLVLIATATITGCGSTKRIRDFTQAMTYYTSALDKLLIASGKLRIESTSEQLLRDDTDDSEQDIQQYQRTRDVLDQRFKLLSGLRSHIRLLGSYFSVLTELADSNAPENASKNAGVLVDEIKALNKTLRSNPTFPEARYTALKGAAIPIFKIAVSSRINRALREELNLRKETIQNELLLQQSLLEAVIDDTKSDLEDLQERRENRILVQTYGTGVIGSGQQEIWIKQRQDILSLRNTVFELEEASKIAKEFRQIYEDFVQGQYSTERIKSVTERMQAVTQAAEKAIE